MFEGFTPETQEFLWGIALNNERPWFLEHKEQYEDCLYTPMKALAEDVAEELNMLYHDMAWQTRVTRIYRDARRLNGNGPYKDKLWFTVRRGDILRDDGPVFFFELGAAKYTYGLGFYKITGAQLRVYRRRIDLDPKRFIKAATAADKLGDFEVTGREYDRIYGNRGPVINKWYKRREPGIACCRDFGEELYSPDFKETLAAAYTELMPLYEFFAEVYHKGNAELAQARRLKKLNAGGGRNDR